MPLEVLATGDESMMEEMEILDPETLMLVTGSAPAKIATARIIRCETAYRWNCSSIAKVVFPA
ncbi:hypothetical protein MesoLjLc_36590 [Mesorhizobium sp. L-8-10]|uniref:hypothetical protein n=1 Tax=unclassified Mesorhizobium TaxID=325217 RepID=UPI001926A1C6|nr:MULTISPECIES: hypothetical protein [unclassified Mesorhizobium]BCH31729.1 hypothetical protein MesoLjLc_36590 [Mesorhizobium sp. L-8-10]